MGKIKLFSHTDLDGVGCVILAYLAFERENVDVEYCNYDDVDGIIRKFYLCCNPEDYDAIYITDISVDKEVAAEIDLLVTAGQKWKLFDHHATALWLNQYKWCEVLVEDETGLKMSGTALFYNYLVLNGFFDHYIMNDRVMNNICRFVDIVRDYDTWRWKELGEEGIVCKQVNDLFYIYAREAFIDWALRRLKFYGSYPEFPSFRDEDLLLLEQKQREIDIYVESKDKQLVEKIDQFGHTYGVVFADRFVNELGDRLSELHPELDYIAMIDISHGTISYRTTSEGIDLGGEIAHSHGGGGHRKAAGSQFDISVVRDLVVMEVLE